MFLAHVANSVGSQFSISTGVQIPRSMLHPQTHLPIPTVQISGSSKTMPAEPAATPPPSYRLSPVSTKPSHPPNPKLPSELMQIMSIRNWRRHRHIGYTMVLRLTPSWTRSRIKWIPAKFSGTLRLWATERWGVSWLPWFTMFLFAAGARGEGAGEGKCARI